VEQIPSWLRIYNQAAHLFQISSVDSSGNIDTTPAVFSWSIAFLDQYFGGQQASQQLQLLQQPMLGPPTHETFHRLLQRFGVKMEDFVNKFGIMHLEPILVDEQLNDNDKIAGTGLQVIHTPGHTPGHISLFHKEYGIIFGADFLFNSVFGTEGLFIPPSVVSIDPLTALVSAQGFHL
jgi:glyoxylase-like metal-dependent hydrolase (beta-lactamase superfamily II)